MRTQSEKLANKLVKAFLKNKPVTNIIIFDKSAYTFSKAFPLTSDLTKSIPPKKIIKPNKTTICMNIFFFEMNLIDR